MDDLRVARGNDADHSGLSVGLRVVIDVLVDRRIVAKLAAAYRHTCAPTRHLSLAVLPARDVRDGVAGLFTLISMTISDTLHDEL